MAIEILNDTQCIFQLIKYHLVYKEKAYDTYIFHYGEGKEEQHSQLIVNGKNTIFSLN